MRTKRKRIGITQERLSELVGISTVQYRSIETGKTRSNWVTVAKICLVLDIDISYIVETYIKPEINGAGKFLGIKINLVTFNENPFCYIYYNVY